MAKKYVYWFGDGTADGDGKMKEVLGGKGAGLAEMCRAGVPVPPGFTISTEVCNIYFENKNTVPQAIEDEMGKSLAKLEKSLGKKLGDAKDPLLLSVRSGAKFSMPGMMNTILNLGLNDETVQGLIALTGVQQHQHIVVDDSVGQRRPRQGFLEDVLGFLAVALAIEDHRARAENPCAPAHLRVGQCALDQRRRARECRPRHFAGIGGGNQRIRIDRQQQVTGAALEQQVQVVRRGSAVADGYDTHAVLPQPDPVSAVLLRDFAGDLGRRLSQQPTQVADERAHRESRSGQLDLRRAGRTLGRPAFGRRPRAILHFPQRVEQPRRNDRRTVASRGEVVGNFDRVEQYGVAAQFAAQRQRDQHDDRDDRQHERDRQDQVDLLQRRHGEQRTDRRCGGPKPRGRAGIGVHRGQLSRPGRPGEAPSSGKWRAAGPFQCGLVDNGVFALD